MDQNLVDVFEQARKLVADADRKIAEEEERRKEREREALLKQLAVRVEEAFDFTSKEKIELDPRLDAEEGGPGQVEFLVRSLRAVFLLSPGENGLWTLQVAEDGRKPQPLGDFAGGTKAEQAQRRLAAARIVTAIGNWAQKINTAQPTLQAVPSSRWQDGATEKREPTYGTLGKFLGY